MKYHHGKSELTVRATDDVVVRKSILIYFAYNLSSAVFEIKNHGT